MKKPSFRIQGIILVVVVALGVRLVLWNMRPAEVLVSIEGPVGTLVSGAYEVDGDSFPISAEVPAIFSVKGRRGEFSIEKDAQPGEISVTLDAKKMGTARTTAGPQELVECGFEKNWGLGGSSVWAHLIGPDGE